jgi:pilus assembly protein Flp/PilA
MPLRFTDYRFRSSTVRTYSPKDLYLSELGRVPMTIFSRFLDDESGATAIEYALIASIVSVSIFAVMQNIRGSLQSTFNSVNSELDAANSK